MAKFKNLNTRNSQHWTTEQLVSFSTSMGRAFCPELNKPELLDAQSEEWTAEQLVDFSASMGRAFYPGW